MKGIVVLAIALMTAQVGFPTTVASAQTAETNKPATGQNAPKTTQEKISYALGIETARNLMRQKIEVDPEMMARGLKDTLTGGKILLTDKELMQTLNEFAGARKQQMGRERMLSALDNKQAGEEFLAANKTREGVVTLTSGLQYKVLKEGAGKKPDPDDTVEVYYSISSIDGAQLEGTNPGEPATIKISDRLVVISGLREALQLMPVGSKWQIFVPYTLAYGTQGKGQIGPNVTLIYDVELSAIK
jgi:FKBP-type peptidyl-prolyl cis-trans isomerase FklB